MADTSVSEASFHKVIREIEVNADEDMDEKWIMLSMNSEQDDNAETSQSSETQEDLKTWTIMPKDGDNQVLCTKANLEDLDTSDSISVITDSDANTDINVNTKFFPIWQFNNNNRFKFLHILKVQGDLRIPILVTFVFGIIIGFLGGSFIASRTISNEIDAESFRAASHNIANIYKELPEESFNSKSYPLDQLQISLHVLSSLTFLDDNKLLKNEKDKILDIMNNTKAIHETLILLNNNAQTSTAVLKFLQSGNDIIRITSELLLYDLKEKMNKVMLNVYNKYTKVEQKLNKKLCHLKNILPDDELLKQLTENHQLFKNYDKSCFSNHTSKKFNDKRAKTSDTKAHNVKKQINTADETAFHIKHDKENIEKIYDNNREKNEKNGATNADNPTMNLTDKVKAEKIKKIKLNMYNNYNEIEHKLSKKQCSLEDILSDSTKSEQRLTKNFGERGKQLFKGENDCIQSIQKDDIPKNILIQLNDTCPLSQLTNWPELNNYRTTVPDHKTENYIVNSNIKRDVNSTKIVPDESSAKVVFAEGKNRPKQKNSFKSKPKSTKKPFNNDNAFSKEKIASPQNKIKNGKPEDTINCHESKQSSFNRHKTKQNDKHYMNTDSQNDINRSYTRKKQWQSDASDWYFQRADSRKKARKYAEYQWNSKRSHRKKRRTDKFKDIWHNFTRDYNKFLHDIFYITRNLI